MSLLKLFVALEVEVMLIQRCTTGFSFQFNRQEFADSIDKYRSQDAAGYHRCVPDCSRPSLRSENSIFSNVNCKPQDGALAGSGAQLGQ